jgi:ankyrin repeat protein
MIAWAITVLTVLFYAMSVVSEWRIVTWFFSDIPRRAIWRWVLRANAISYAFLLLLVLGASLWPRVTEPVSVAMSPVNEVLVGQALGLLQRYSSEKAEQPEPPLLRAASTRDARAIHHLLREGADVNVRGKYGETALHHAAGLGDVALVRTLLEAGADVNARRDGPIDYAPLHTAAYTGNGATVQALIAAGARVNEPAGGGWTALMIAMLYGRRDVVEALLAGSADVNARSPRGWTALKEAEMRGHRDLIGLLMASGAIAYPDGSR